MGAKLLLKSILFISTLYNYLIYRNLLISFIAVVNIQNMKLYSITYSSTDDSLFQFTMTDISFVNVTLANISTSSSSRNYIIETGLGTNINMENIYLNTYSLTISYFINTVATLKNLTLYNNNIKSSRGPVMRFKESEVDASIITLQN
jgi:hypothetical protein